jgi:alpha-1,2-mannosyltransferase/arabinofuranan 3-O-arabinosyltransferase
MGQTRWISGALAVLLVGWLFASTLHRAGPTETRSVARSDLPAYLAAAAVIQDGEDPFGVVSERGWPYVYPPTLAALLVPLVALPQRVSAAIWFMLSFTIMVCGMIAFRRALGRRGAFRWVDDGWPLTLVFFPIASCLERGQVGALLLGLVGLGFRFFSQKRNTLCALSVGLAVAIKTTPALLFLVIAGARRGRAFAACVVALAAWLVLAPAPYLGFAGSAKAAYHHTDRMVLRYLHDPGAPNLTENSSFDVHINTNQSLTSQIVRRTSGTARQALLLLSVLVILAPLFVVLVRGSSPPAETWSLALAATLLLSPVAWHHHHVLLWPALFVLTQRRRERVVTPILAAFCVLSVLHFAGKNTALGDAGLLGMGTLLVYGTLFSCASGAKDPVGQSM